MTRMKLFVALGGFLILFPLTSLKAQFKNYNTEKDIWYDGTITDQSGKTARGLINYNFVVDQVKIKFASGKVQTMIPNNTRSFTISDANVTQTFHSLPFDLKGNGRHVNTFFKEYYRDGNYAVLSRHQLNFTPANIIAESPSAGSRSVSTNPARNDPSRNNAKELVIETIYFADRKGNIIPIIHGKKSANWNPHLSQKGKYNEKKLKQSSVDKEVKKYKFVNYKDNFREFFGKDFKAFKKNSEDNNLDLRTIEGLIESLSFK